MSLAMTPRTGNRHEVGGEFPDDHLHLLVGRFPNRVRVVCGICALMLSADTASDMFDVFLS